MLSLRPVKEVDADALFPLIYQSPITDWIIWDGPASLDELRSGLREREQMMRNGDLHAFTIWVDEVPIGSIRIAPNHPNRSGEVGLWIGEQFHGKGYGSEAVRLITEMGFRELDLNRLEARIFVGNTGSRRIFEKNGYQLEGTMRQLTLKRGEFRDEWLFARLRSDRV